MKQMILLYKEDKTLLGLAIFYSILYSVIIFLFSLVMPLNLITLLLFSLILFSLFIKFLSNLREEKLLKKTFWFTFYFSLSPIISYISITMPLYIKKIELLNNVLFMSMFYLICMIFPYLFFATLILSKKHRNLINENIKVIRVSLSFMIAISTVLFTLAPMMVSKENLSLLYIVTLLPFSINILLICIIEYFQVKKELFNDAA